MLKYFLNSLNIQNKNHNFKFHNRDYLYKVPFADREIYNAKEKFYRCSKCGMLISFIYFVKNTINTPKLSVLVDELFIHVDNSILQIRKWELKKHEIYYLPNCNKIIMQRACQ